MSLATALGMYLGGQGRAKRERAAADSTNAYNQRSLDLEQQRFGAEQAQQQTQNTRQAAQDAEKKRYDDAQLRPLGIDPATGQYFPFTPNTQTRPNNHGKVYSSDSDPATLAANARRLAGEAMRAQRPDQAKFYLDQAASYDLGAQRESTVGANQAKAQLEHAQAYYAQNRLGISLQEAQIKAKSAMYGADQRYRGAIAAANSHIYAAVASAQARDFGSQMAAAALVQGKNIDQATRIGIASAHDVEQYQATEGKASGAFAPLSPLAVPSQQSIPFPQPPDFTSPQSGGGLAPQYVSAMQQAGQRWGVEPSLLQRVAMAESGGNPNTQPSPAGAVGLMQFMPATAKGFGFNPSDPMASINGAAQYLGQLKQKNGGDQTLALVEYNGGAPAVAAWKAGKPFPESTAYVQKIMGGGGGPAPKPPTQTPTTQTANVGGKVAPAQGGDHEQKARKWISSWVASPEASGKSFEEQWAILSQKLASAPDTTPADYAVAQKLLREHNENAVRNQKAAASSFAASKKKSELAQLEGLGIPAPAGGTASRGGACRS